MSPRTSESTEPSPTAPEPRDGDERRLTRRSLFGASAGAAAAAIVSRTATFIASRPTLPGILDSDRFGRRQAVLGGLGKQESPLPVSRASRYNSAAAIGTGSLR